MCTLADWCYYRIALYFGAQLSRIGYAEGFYKKKKKTTHEARGQVNGEENQRLVSRARVW